MNMAFFNYLLIMEEYNFTKIITFIEIIINSNNVFYISYYYLILLYIFFTWYLIYNYIFYFQQVILNSIYTYICCLKLLVENKRYNYVLVTLTNMNLKNYFLLSGLNFYIFVIIYYIIYFIATINNFTLKKYLDIKNHFVDVFYFNDYLNSLFFFQNIILINILFIIILHILLGLYMLFFDYLKNSSFILWTFSLFSTNVLIFYFICLII